MSAKFPPHFRNEALYKYCAEIGDCLFVEYNAAYCCGDIEIAGGMKLWLAHEFFATEKNQLGFIGFDNIPLKSQAALALECQDHWLSLPPDDENSKHKTNREAIDAADWQERLRTIPPRE